MDHRVVLVTGGRTFSDENLLHDLLGQALDQCIKLGLSLVIVQGGANGADRIARTWAKLAKDIGEPVSVITEEANWTDLSQPGAVIRTRRDGTQYDAMAGIRRNQAMLDKHNPDYFIAMPGGNGTNDMVDRCHKAHIPGTVWDQAGTGR